MGRWELLLFGADRIGDRLEVPRTRHNSVSLLFWAPHNWWAVWVVEADRNCLGLRSLTQAAHRNWRAHSLAEIGHNWPESSADCNWVAPPPYKQAWNHVV